MQNSIISEGKTTNEAIENGLKKLGVTKKDVEIKVLEEEKKSFFDILAPRIVKVELILKEGKKDHREVKVGEKDIEEAVNKTKDFLNDLKKELGNIEYAIEIKEDIIYIKIEGEKAADLIGYRGETLESIQNIISAIANKETSARVKIIVDILNYKGYYIKKSGNYMSVSSPYYNRNIRLARAFGEDYTFENIKTRIYHRGLYDYINANKQEKVYKVRIYDGIKID